MAINFKIRDFFYPIEILKLRSFLEKSQWLSEERLREYQLKRLRLILNHTYENVPYYRSLFDKIRFKPRDFKELDDLKRIPYLTKEILKKNFKSLMAKNAKRFNPILNRTSGTSGEPVEFYLDKSSNILEFCYYWRHWSWAGYRLGMPFIKFDLIHFLNTKSEDIAHYSPLTRCLILNPSMVSYDNLDRFIKEIRKYKPLFLNGCPSTIYILSVLLEKKDCNDLSLKAIFTGGETLLPYQREKIEKIFNCSILDSYGHMERTVAISQCPLGRYHVNLEYGILEIDKNEELSSDRKIVGQAVGTSLYNFAMPLIRYKIGDLIEIDSDHKACGCKRGLPIVERIKGRTQDALITKDGRIVTETFILFDYIEGILWYQIIQDNMDVVLVRLLPDNNFTIYEKEKMLLYLQRLLGKDIRIDLEVVTWKDVKISLDRKHRSVISKVMNNSCI